MLHSPSQGHSFRHAQIRQMVKANLSGTFHFTRSRELNTLVCLNTNNEQDKRPSAGYTFLHSFVP